MHEFLRGWKRKFGIIALIVACLAMAGWMRSVSTGDEFSFVFRNYRCSIGSEDGELSWWSCQLRRAKLASFGDFDCSTWQSRRAELRQIDEELKGLTPPPPSADQEKISVVSIIHLSFPTRSDPRLYEMMRAAGVEFDSHEFLPMPEQTPVTWAVSYWSVVTPLILLAAYLLFSKRPPLSKRTMNPPSVPDSRRDVQAASIGS